MKNNRSRILEEEFGDAALNLLLDEYSERSGAELLKAYQASAKGEFLPSELDKTCTKMIQHTFHKHHLKVAAARCAKVAVVMIVCLCISITMIMSVEALRIPVLNFYLVRFPRYSQILPQSAKGSELVDLFSSLQDNCTSFAPKEYTLIQSEQSPGSFFAAYQNASGDCASISAYDNDGVVHFDSENCTETKLTVNGMEAYHWKKTDDPEQRLLLIAPDHGINCYLCARNMPEDDFWMFVYTFASFL